MTKSVWIVFVGLWIAFSSASALAYAHANRYGGGDTYHAEGSDSTTRTNAYGGSATHTAGEGTTATSAWGGSATHVEGSGQTEMSGADGGSATHYAGYGTVGTSAYGTTAYHSPYYGTTAVYPAYHPPTTVDYYGSSCGNCGGWSTAGAAAAGLVAGAAVATAVTSSENADTNAYNAGVAAGESSAYVAANGAGSPNATTYAMGGIYPTLPSGCMTPTVSGTSYYLCGNTWFLPSYGANGVYYRVVAAP